MKLGAYTLIKKIAEGGVADIYLAKIKTSQLQDKYLVCKCIRQSLTQDDEFLGSIINEAQCTTRLRHPNILEVFDLCACDGNAFLAMEYLDAQDFSKLIIHNNARNETVPYTYAAYAIGQVALGLHAAHTLNDVHGKPLHLVHRDVSPENILFSSDGAIKIGDFGIAKTVQMPDITPPDVVKGKFNYMSPEQAWADKIDLRSDIFSLAAVLYEATTGHCFYPAESIEACIQCARMALFELPHNVCPTFPPALEAIMLKALDLDKKCRYSSALEFKLALDSFIASQGVNITKEDWIEYIKPRIEYPPMPLPRLCASEFEPDASSLLAHSIYRGVSDDKAVEDINTTGQIGAEEIDQLRRQVISMMSSEFNVLVLQNAAQNPQSSASNTASMPSTEDDDETRTTNPRNRAVSSKNATVDASNATLQTPHEAALCPKMTYKKWIYIGVLVAVILLAVLIRSC